MRTISSYPSLSLARVLAVYLFCIRKNTSILLALSLSLCISISLTLYLSFFSFLCPSEMNTFIEQTKMHSSSLCFVVFFVVVPN